MKISGLLVSLLCVQSLFAQLPNQAFYDLHNQDSILPQRWLNSTEKKDANSWQKIGNQTYLDFYSIGFCRNNEYFTDIDPGHTFFGYQLMPSVVWQPFGRENLEVKGGVFLQRNFGEDSFSQSAPTFTMSYTSGKTRFVLGTLYGGLEHQLIEPLYRFERALYDRIENGFQIIHKSKKIDADLWIDWKQTTYPTLNRPEILRPGLRVNYLVSKETSNHNLKIEFQATNQHEGGALSESPTLNRSNFAIGTTYQYQLQTQTSLFFKPYFVYALDHSATVLQPFKDGYGLYANAGLTHKHITAMLSYWYGEEYFSPGGMPYLGSFSYSNFYAMERTRELLFARIIYTKELIPQHFTIDLRVEPILDLLNRSLDYSFGIYFIYRMGL